MQRALATEKHPLPRPSPASGRGEKLTQFDTLLSTNFFKFPLPLAGWVLFDTWLSANPFKSPLSRVRERGWGRGK